MRTGTDNLNDQSEQFDESLSVAGMMKANMLDLSDLSLGSNTDDIKERSLAEIAFVIERGARVRREVGIPVGVSRNLGDRRCRTLTGRSGRRGSWPMLTRFLWPRRTGSGGGGACAPTSPALDGLSRAGP